jgi:hypothetical protein
MMNAKIDSLTKTLKQKGVIKDMTEEEEENQKAVPPIDYEFLIGEKRLIESPRLNIPQGSFLDIPYKNKLN